MSVEHSTGAGTERGTMEMRNVVPENHIRVEAVKLREFVLKAGRAVGLPEDKAALLAELLTGSDLKGNFSHGTQAIGRYCRAMLNGQINDNPQVKIVEETESSLVVDGDGGLGYFPCYEGTLALIEKLAGVLESETPLRLAEFTPETRIAERAEQYRLIQALAGVRPQRE